MWPDMRPLSLIAGHPPSEANSERRNESILSSSPLSIGLPQYPSNCKFYTTTQTALGFELECFCNPGGCQLANVLPEPQEHQYDVEH